MRTVRGPVKTGIVTGFTRVVLCFAAFGLGAATSALAAAAPRSTAFAATGYPEKPIRFILGFPPGGGSDILARVIGQKLSDAWGQQVVIDNRPGAGGNIAAAIAARSAPDGYTLYLGTSSSHAINKSLYRKLDYDPEKDFAPVTLVASAQNILAVHPSVAAKSVRELIALAKQRPGQLSYASTGIGTSSHLAAELFKHMAGVDIVHIPYKGPAAMIDLISGQVQMTFGRIPVVLPHAKSGRLRMLAVTGARRSALLPQVPTVAESGLPGFEVSAWFGVLVPAGTPGRIVSKLNAGIAGILNDPAVRERLVSEDFEVLTSTPEQFASHIRSETLKWARVIKVTGIRAD
jgi:tripartite-type tricarboxylate transporter receptor subunit TctC